MVVEWDRCVLGGDVRGHGVRVTSKRQWGFVLFVVEVHDEREGCSDVGVGMRSGVGIRCRSCSVGPAFMSVWALLLRWGIGDRSRRLVLGRVSDAPLVPRCCHLWEILST